MDARLGEAFCGKVLKEEDEVDVVETRLVVLFPIACIALSELTNKGIALFVGST